MMVVIRPLAAREYGQVAALYSTVYPERGDQAAAWRHADRHAAAQSAVARWVAVRPQAPQVVGYGAFWPVRLDKYRLALVVHPGWRGRGVGGRLLDRLLEGLRAGGTGTAQARADAADLPTLAFLRRRGFAETQRMVELRLPLADAHLPPLGATLDRLATAGIGVRTLADEEGRDPACWGRLLELQQAVEVDWPDPDPGPPEPLALDAFRRRLTGLPIIPEAFFIATHGERYVGYGGLAHPDASRRVVESGGTAVRPEYRGRGVATALKACCLAYARRQGYEEARTRSANPAVVRVNEKFGFRRGPVEVRLVGRLT